MNLNDVHRGIHKHKSREAFGRGQAPAMARRPAAATRARARGPATVRSPIFEGGQMPLVRRVPKRGFHNRWADRVAIVNVDELGADFQAGEEVTPETLCGKALVKGSYDELKVLGDGELTKNLKVSAHRSAAGVGEDREGRRRGGRVARQGAGGQEQDEEGERRLEIAAGVAGMRLRVPSASRWSREALTYYGRIESCGKRFASSSRSRNCVRRSF